MPVELMPRIVVVGVGGAGGNAVENMIKTGLKGVEFVVANTDSQALSRSSAPIKLQLGVTRTAGLGAGANPEVGAEAAKESHDDIKKLLHGAHMCFIAAGMGGGTGTGAAPIIARMAKEQKVLTVGVVTKPFDFEGKRRMQVAEKGIAELRGEVDTLIVIPNQNLMRVANRQTTFVQAFEMADDVLRAGVRGITDLMVMPGLINLDFADVRTVMAGMGTAMMGQGEAEGENRALVAARAAITNPLLDDVSLKGAKGVIINITGGYDMTLFEVDEAANEIRREVDVDGHMILGSTFDENMAGRIRVSVVAAGIAQNATGQNATGQNSSHLQQPAARPSVRDMLREAAAPMAAPQPVQPPPQSLYQPPSQPSVQAWQPPPPSPQQLTEAFEPVRQSAPQQAPDLPPLFSPAQQARVAPVIRRPTPIEDSLMAEREELELVQRAPQAPPVQAGHPPHEAPGQAGRSFSSLFGWKKPAAEGPAAAPTALADEDKFDDELEIPAFLRRSANN